MWPKIIALRSNPLHMGYNSIGKWRTFFLSFFVSMLFFHHTFPILVTWIQINVNLGKFSFTSKWIFWWKWFWLIKCLVYFEQTLMGAFFYVHSVALIEDLPINHTWTNPHIFYKEADNAYLTVSTHQILRETNRFYMDFQVLIFLFPSFFC